MTIAKHMSLALALALSMGAAVTGCAADQTSTPPGDDDGSGSGSGSGGDPLPQDVDAAGKYAVQSKFDLAQNMPGTAGDVTRTIIAATDDSADPSLWIIEQAINAMPNGTFKSFLNGAKPFVAGYINDRLLEIAPDFVTTMVTMGNDFGDAAKNFGLNSTLDVSKSGTSYTAVHTVLGAHFKINNVESDYAFADYGVANTVVPGVGVTVDTTGKLGLADHKVPVAYGKVLRIGLDAAIIPSLDPTASNLGQLLQHQVDCQTVGQVMEQYCEDNFGFGPGSGTFQSACNAGLTAGANLIYSKIDAIDASALEFALTGTAKALDKNNDKKLDTIQSGTWAGTLSYAGTPAPLANATFFGSRM